MIHGEVEKKLFERVEAKTGSQLRVDVTKRH